MVVVSKLKVALNAEQKKDFGKEFQKKMAKKARKEQMSKPAKEVEVEEEDAEMGGGSSEDEDEEGLAELMEMEGELESGDERQVSFTCVCEALVYATELRRFAAKKHTDKCRRST